MRDIVVTLIVLFGYVYTLRRPYIGILLWSWLSYMNPHRLSFGFAYHMPFAQITIFILVLSMIFSKDTREFPFNALTILWLIFILFMGVTTFTAHFPDMALEQYMKVVKIQIVSLLTIKLITDIRKVNHLIWTIVLSIGFYSVKGGLFTLLTAGAHRVWGPPDSFIADNNELAVAVLMIIPLMIYLYQVHNNKLVKIGLAVAAILSLFTIIGSQSRGAFVAIAVFGLFYWIKSKHKVVTGLFVITLSAGLLIFAPQSWHERMNSIPNYQMDSSSLGRLNAWQYAFNVANNNLFGFGFESWTAETFLLYAPNPEDVHVAHSIYFSVLADHGWIGLFIFVLIFYLSWNKLKFLVKNTKDIPDLMEVNLLARRLQLSFVAYFVGGAFLSLSYFDLPWHMVGFVIILNRILDDWRNSPNTVSSSSVQSSQNSTRNQLRI